MYFKNPTESTHLMTAAKFPLMEFYLETLEKKNGGEQGRKIEHICITIKRVTDGGRKQVRRERDVDM